MTSLEKKPQRGFIHFEKDMGEIDEGTYQE